MSFLNMLNVKNCTPRVAERDAPTPAGRRRVRMNRQWRAFESFHSPLDPCPPRPKAYIVPPNQYYVMQPKGLRQYAPREALRRGTLWPDLYSPYERPFREGVSHGADGS
jgi:spore coat protein JA